MIDISRALLKFLRLPFRQKILVLVTFILLGITRMLILLIPFRYVSLLFGESMKETTEDVSNNMYEKARSISLVINRVSKYTPWESKCLVQAFTAQLLLRFYKIPTTLYLGIDKDNYKIQAHAWLRCGNYIVTGDGGREQFRTVAKFAYFGRGN